MAGLGRYHRQVMTQHAAAQALHLELQLTRQAEHQLGVVMAVAEHFMAVVAQGQGREHGGSSVNAGV